MFAMQSQNLTTNVDMKSMHDRIVFKNVADQYVKGEDVTVFVSILQSLKANSDQDEIGLTRIGSSNVKQCFICVPIQFQTSASSDSMIHGTATFPAENLPVTDDEFYQFWYIRNKSNYLAASLPFQLNCTPDEVDFLSDVVRQKSKSDSQASLFDQDSDDIIVIHNKTNSTDGNFCGSECLQNAERCRLLESVNAKQLDEIARMCSQLDAMRQLTKDQATQIVDFERRLIQADRLLKISNEEKLSHEQQLRDVRLTSEKYQRSAQGQIQHLSTIKTTADHQLRDLQLTSQKYQRSAQGQIQHLSTGTTTADQQLRDLQLTFEKYQQSAEIQLKCYSNRIAQQDQRINELEKINKLLEERLDCLSIVHDEINDENILKRQLNIYQQFINDLQHETKCLSKRLSSECKPKTNCNASSQSLINTDQVQQCPVCPFQFPKDFTVERKNEHIERHFQ